MGINLNQTPDLFTFDVSETFHIGFTPEFSTSTLHQSINTGRYRYSQRELQQFITLGLLVRVEDFRPRRIQYTEQFLVQQLQELSIVEDEELLSDQGDNDMEYDSDFGNVSDEELIMQDTSDLNLSLDLSGTPPTNTSSSNTSIPTPTPTQTRCKLIFKQKKRKLDDEEN